MSSGLVTLGMIVLWTMVTDIIVRWTIISVIMVQKTMVTDIIVRWTMNTSTSSPCDHLVCEFDEH